MSHKSRWGKGIFKAGKGRHRPNHATSGVAGFTVSNKRVGAAIVRVMYTVPNVRVKLLPSFIRVDTADRVDVVYDDVAEALGEEPGSFDAAALESVITEHDGQMIHAEGRTIFFAKPEDAAAYIATAKRFAAADRFEDASPADVPGHYGTRAPPNCARRTCCAG